ncbi:DMT family transporter [Sphingomonas spermidinifaciens]|uniref:DMT family transporter n=1 Tax=Sphingomonas spermidinifaciens TaxID=1141889 RepID=UPI001FEC964A|nr:DMT family transporter [Sphingomonas spermidinifaciens]
MRDGGGAAQGLLFGVAGFALLSCGDAVIKTTVDEWPASAIAALRYLFGAIGLGIAVFATEGVGALRVPRPGLQVARALAVSVASFGFFMALRSMPLANATAVQFTSPALTAMLSALFLGERAPRAAWGATALAFMGVLIVLRPDVARMGWAVGWPLLAALGLASMMILNRRAAGTGSALAMQYSVALFATPILVAAAVAGHVSGWPPMQAGMPGWSVIVRCALVGVSASAAHLLVYLATVRSSAAVVAPTMYVQLLTALALGAAVFGDRPDPVALLGAGLVVTSGLWLWHSQRPRTVPETE